MMKRGRVVEAGSDDDLINQKHKILAGMTHHLLAYLPVVDASYRATRRNCFGLSGVWD